MSVNLRLRHCEAQLLLHLLHVSNSCSTLAVVAPASLTWSASDLCVFQGPKWGNAQSLVRSWRGRYLLTPLEWWYGSLAVWGDKSFQNSFSKQKVARAASSEQLNETTGLTKAPVQRSMVGHPRRCKELREELLGCPIGTLPTAQRYICQFTPK